MGVSVKKLCCRKLRNSYREANSGDETDYLGHMRACLDVFSKLRKSPLLNGR